MESNILSPKEIRRYSCQIDLPDVGIAGQELIKQAKVLVVGAGGKGTSVLQNLTTIGIGTLGISDNYPVEENELCRQRLYGNGDLGKQKAIISKQYLEVVNHLVNIQLHNVCLAEHNIYTIAESYDILVDATDNFPAHFLLNNASKKLKKPLVFGSIFHCTAMLSIFNFNGGPSLRDLFPATPSGESKPDKSNVYSSGIVTNILGSLMANEVLKIILGQESELNGNLFKFDVSNYSSSFSEISISEKQKE